MNTYYTLCHDEQIQENADFASRKTLEQGLQTEGESGDIIFTGWQESSFGDCWIKMVMKPSADDLQRLADSDGIDVDDFIISAPGTHPGGNMWWLSIQGALMVPVWVEVE